MKIHLPLRAWENPGAKPSSGGRTLPLSLTKTDDSIVEPSPNLERRWSFSLLLLLLSLLFSFSYSLQFSSPHQNDPICLSGNLILSLVTLSLVLFDFTLSPYPNLWISILLSGGTCPTWVPLDFCLTYLSI